MEKGIQRWKVDISEWDPSPHDFSLALSLLPIHQHSSISRFYRMEDRKRALVSRLLQYALVHEVVGIPYDEIVINRTLEGKPYLEYDDVDMRFPNFNFNVSHQGDYVVIASEPLCLVGVDVVCCIQPQKETVLEFIQNFTLYFSSLEWNNIINAGNLNEILMEFYRSSSFLVYLFLHQIPHLIARYWCLKEAYVKAIGSGLVYGLEKVEFHHNNWTNITVEIDGKPMVEWGFWLFELQRTHLAAVARGHPKSASESYKSTLSRVDFDQEEYRKGFSLPNVEFVARTVEQLVSHLHDARNMLEGKNT